MSVETRINMSDEADGKYLTDEEKWQAVLRRDKTADGQFFFSVATTGVFCRPSCGARQPRRENVDFHTSPLDAETAGFRACKRCKPTETPTWHERTDLVAKACRFIEESETAPPLAEVAAHIGLSPYHFHRVFKEVTGVTPKAYATSHRTKNVKGSLKESRTVTEAIYDAGYNANSRFYENAQGMLGMTPKEYRAGGSGKTIRYAIAACSLGFVLVGATDRGICTIQLGDDHAGLEAALMSEFPGAVLEEASTELKAWVGTAIAMIEDGKSAPATLPLDIRGTAFQQRVWAVLREIPSGETKSYKDVAEAIGSPEAVRAVARACASNRIAVAIPCHRVVRSNGGISGYRWGVERKRVLLEKESA
ncbi:bifunctional DNA-binding transcriptional regulator/O6-methylguanine-DNA methyltransferase Ada [Kordiimonas sp.]|uniref:bifunctional DNA-binding transcriptional regulator/O6-methylguanine-DNA methyltransferase Ada n=1 Tax=Kordiimonas sp. TaxID=1970157 RepID=UPI003B51FBBE